jgi:hypothetical protein
MRTFFIWFFGLIAFGLMGLVVGGALNRHSGDGGEFLGFIGGMAAFACVRLWMGSRSTSARS